MPGEKSGCRLDKETRGSQKLTQTSWEGQDRWPDQGHWWSQGFEDMPLGFGDQTDVRPGKEAAQEASLPGD